MARIQGVAIAVLSLWMGWTLFMWFAATRSFQTAEHMANSPPPEFSRIAPGLNSENTRPVLRHLASEINRMYFRAYGWGQIVLGVALVLLFLLEIPRDRVSLAIVAGMLVVVLILTFGVMPQIISLGRTIDFLPRNPPPPGYSRFWKLHATFTTLDGAKLLAGLAALVRLIAFR